MASVAIVCFVVASVGIVCVVVASVGLGLFLVTSVERSRSRPSVGFFFFIDALAAGFAFAVILIFNGCKD